MKKTHKRTVSLVLAIVICLSFSVSAFAAAMPSSLVSEVTEMVNSLMTAIEPNKSMYGLGGVDFTNLTLGQEIPAYEMKSSGPDTQSLLSDSNPSRNILSHNIARL